MEWAIFGGAAVVACGCLLVACVWAFGIGFTVYAYFTHLYGNRLHHTRLDAYSRGRHDAERERAEKIIAQDGPRTALEQEDLRSYAEGLAPLYAGDKDLKAALEEAQKLKKMIDAE